MQSFNFGEKDTSSSAGKSCFGKAQITFPILEPFAYLGQDGSIKICRRQPRPVLLPVPEILGTALFSLGLG